MEADAPVPAGYTIRAPRPDHVATVFEVFEAYNTTVLGFADCTLDDVVDNFAEPGFDPATDAWLAHHDDGRPSGYGCVFPGTGAPEHHIEVAATDPVLARWLLDRATDRSQAIARDGGHTKVTIDIGIYRADDSLRALVSDVGFEIGTTFHRMRIDHDRPTAAPDLPTDVTVRNGAVDLGARRAAYDILRQAFDGQFGFVPKTYEEWHSARDARPTFEWSQLVVLELGRKPVASRDDTSQFVEDEHCGYVANLGVLPEARGRGLAKLLLRDAFATHSAAGLTGTILHVDTNNPTPALGLYTSVGMEPVLVIDVWRAVLPT